MTLTHLLHLCRDEHRVLWEQVSDPANTSRITAALAGLTHMFPGPGVATNLDKPIRQAVAAALQPSDAFPPVVIAHALAQLIDERYEHTFTDSFRRRSPYQPAVGDPIPLGGPDLRPVMDMHPTSPPWRLANRLDETRHVRLAGEWAVEFQVVFDYSLLDTLTDIITADTIVATCQPNRTLEDFNLPADLRLPTFPVHPIDVDRQRQEINRLIGTATSAGATIVVLPELCITESLAWELHDWVCRADGPRLLVAGSYHHRGEQSGASLPRRSNTAIAWVRGHDLPLTHDKHSPADHPIIEDIQPQGWPELRVYITADGWHLMIAICRDLLNPQAVHAITEAGVNLLLVPAMSETLVTFAGPTAYLVGSAQALVAIANNPADWSQPGERVAGQPARALFGHPGLSQLTRSVQAPDLEPGVALLHVGSARINWLTAERSASRDEPPTSETDLSPASRETPEWVTRLAKETRQYRPLEHTPTQPLTLRPAAILVLFTQGPAGPRLLLTERAPDLRDYPGQLVFPGGAAEPQDRGPVATALREASEEVGLDADSVHIIGLLAAIALPDSRFLVTPVLAWSAQPGFTHSANPGEVTAVHQVALQQLAGGRHRAAQSRDRDPAARSPQPDPASLGRMTATIIETVLTILAACEPS